MNKDFIEFASKWGLYGITDEEYEEHFVKHHPRLNYIAIVRRIKNDRQWKIQHRMYHYESFDDFYLTDEWSDLREEVFDEMRICCVICHRVDDIVCHHVLYLRDWPAFKLDRHNILPLCRRCHDKLHGYDGDGNKIERSKDIELKVYKIALLRLLSHIRVNSNS